MKIYTICNKGQSEINISNEFGCKKQEYSYQEYLNFLNQGKKFYVHMLHSYYETDMSDHSEGSDVFDFSINYNNMVIKDNSLFGVLVSTTTFSPYYYVYPLGKYNLGVELEGGYNSNAYDWWYKQNDLSDQLTLDASLKYLLINETICYNNEGEIIIYQRKLINPIQKHIIVKNNTAVGFCFDEYKFDFNDSKSLNFKTGCEIYTALEIDEEFLQNNVFDVSYEDFKNGNYKILGLKN